MCRNSLANTSEVNNWENLEDQLVSKAAEDEWVIFEL